MGAPRMGTMSKRSEISLSKARRRSNIIFLSGIRPLGVLLNLRALNKETLYLTFQ